jgi:hypothetical protein
MIVFCVGFYVVMLAAWTWVAVTIASVAGRSSPSWPVSAPPPPGRGFTIDDD